MNAFSSLKAGLLIFLMFDPNAHAQGIVYHFGQSAAEACAARVADPEERSARILRLCENALHAPDLTPASYAATLTNTGIVKMRRGDLDAALADFQAAHAEDAASPDVAINLGAALVRLGRFDEALNVLADPKAISRERRHVAYLNRAIAHWALEDVAHAHEDLTVATALKPDYAPAREMLQHFQVADAN